MPKIIEIVRARRDAIRGNQAEAERTGKLAVDAIKGGLGSDAWKAYMEHFPGLNPAQLRRLNAEDGTDGDAVLDKKRAYVLANAVCGTASPMTRNLDLLVNSIDNGLAEGPCEPDPNPALLAE